MQVANNGSALPPAIELALPAHGGLDQPNQASSSAPVPDHLGHAEAANVGIAHEEDAPAAVAAPASWCEASQVAWRQALKDAVSVFGSSAAAFGLQVGLRAAVAAAGGGPAATLAVAAILTTAINVSATQHMAHAFVPSNVARIVGGALGAGIVASATVPALTESTQAAADAAIRMLGTSIYSGLRDVIQGALKPVVRDLGGAPALVQLPEGATNVEYGPARAYGRVLATTSIYGAMQMGAASLASYAFPQVSDDTLKGFLNIFTRTAVEGLDAFAGVMMKKAFHPDSVKVNQPKATTWGETFKSIANNASFRVALNAVATTLTNVVPSRLAGVTGEPYATNAYVTLTEVRGQLVNAAESHQKAAENLAARAAQAAQAAQEPPSHSVHFHDAPSESHSSVVHFHHHGVAENEDDAIAARLP